ncbi:MAG TPA: hypothetical protein VF416_10265 [Marmoricola sp.]
MESPFDDRWVEDVCGLCDPVFEAAEVGFVRQIQYADPARRTISAFLWEADPNKFAERYPDSGIVESYGEAQWPGVHCIDYWAHIEQEDRRCRISVEGWNLPDLRVELLGRGRLDGAAIADTFARILGVPSPGT